MGSMDIVIYAVIAAVVLARLWAVFGRRDGDDAKRPNPFVVPPRSVQTPPDEGDVLRLPTRAKTEETAPVITAAGHAIDSLAGGLDQVKKLDPTFDEKAFLQGGRAAFTMILADFAQGDLSRSARLLAPAVLERFRHAISERVAAGHALDTKLDKISEADVTAARVDGTQVVLTVAITSRQINTLRDAQGQILSVTAGKGEDVHDVWVFARDTKSADPNWVLVETKA